MDPIKTTVTITGFCRDLGEVVRMYDRYRQPNGWLRGNPGPPVAEIEITVRSDKMEHTHKLDLSLSCPQFEQLEQGIIKAVQEFRESEDQCQAQ